MIATRISPKMSYGEMLLVGNGGGGAGGGTVFEEVDDCKLDDVELDCVVEDVEVLVVDALEEVRVLVTEEVEVVEKDEAVEVDVAEEEWLLEVVKEDVVELVVVQTQVTAGFSPYIVAPSANNTRPPPADGVVKCGSTPGATKGGSVNMREPVSGFRA